jgi:hypothetical protein
MTPILVTISVTNGQNLSESKSGAEDIDILLIFSDGYQKSGLALILLNVFDQRWGMIPFFLGKITETGSES